MREGFVEDHDGKENWRTSSGELGDGVELVYLLQ